jgi:hypothetical protein
MIYNALPRRFENDYRDHGFDEDAQFIVRLELAEKGWKDEKPLREDRPLTRLTKSGTLLLEAG